MHDQPHHVTRTCPTLLSRMSRVPHELATINAIVFFLLR
jgi:hypothetical protein